MTTINTSDDLLRLLREDTHFYDQARRLILTDELIALPGRFADFTAKQDRFNLRVDARFDRIESDLSHFKNRFSENQVAEEAATIAMTMGFELVRIVNNSELVQMARQPQARLLPQGDVISFTRADLMMGVADHEGKAAFVAIEISYTADQRDTDRARRNADYITRFTDQPAHAAVASARNDHDTQHLIDQGIVWWYPLEDETDGTATR